MVKKFDTMADLAAHYKPAPGEMIPVTESELKSIAAAAKIAPPPWPTAEDVYKREIRIEALRAASRIVAGAFSSNKSVFNRMDFLDDDGKKITSCEWVLLAAEQFARWLATGER